MTEVVAIGDIVVDVFVVGFVEVTVLVLTLEVVLLLVFELDVIFEEGVVLVDLTEVEVVFVETGLDVIEVVRLEVLDLLSVPVLATVVALVVCVALPRPLANGTVVVETDSAAPLAGARLARLSIWPGSCTFQQSMTSRRQLTTHAASRRLHAVCKSVSLRA